MKQLKLNTDCKKFFETVFFFQKEVKTAPKTPLLSFLVY